MSPTIVFSVKQEGLVSVGIEKQGTKVNHQ